MAAKVFFTPDVSKISLLFDQLKDNISGKNIALKTHFGEAGSTTYLPPKLVKIIYDRLKSLGFNPKLVEANVLYQGERTFAKSHIKLAKQHGFNFAPIDIYDEKGADDCWPIKINKKHFPIIKVAKNLKNYDFLVVVSHFKGHVSTGFGGALKNIGMGLGSRAGKLMMHANLAPEVDVNKCIACGKCLKSCPVNAIKLVAGKAKIYSEVCIGCATCIAVCEQRAVLGPPTSPTELQERIVEFCFGILQKIPAIYFNFLVNITAHCDCRGEEQKKLIDDIGFLASTDPVAIDQASYDLFRKQAAGDIFKKEHKVSGLRQLEYGQEIGLGSRDYELIKI